MWLRHIYLKEAKIIPANNFQGTLCWQCFNCQVLRPLKEMGCRTSTSWRPGYEVEDAEHGGRTMRGRMPCRLSTCRISHPADCQGAIVRQLQSGLW